MNLISIFDLSSAEIEAILEKAAELKRERSEKFVEGTFAENIFISLESLSIT
ncbi:MAG: hypothetical protein U9O85_03940 [Euryarchaeota archaeon]|nr:hypothetical protein [Euryarchaeota archaeon]